MARQKPAAACMGRPYTVVTCGSLASASILDGNVTPRSLNDMRPVGCGSAGQYLRQDPDAADVQVLTKACIWGNNLYNAGKGKVLEQARNSSPYLANRDPHTCTPQQRPTPTDTDHIDLVRLLQPPQWRCCVDCTVQHRC